MKLQEEKNVSATTVRIANDLYSIIIDDARHEYENVGEYLGIRFKDNEFRYDTQSEIGTILVKYNVFYCNNVEEYKYLANNGTLNNIADYKAKTMSINIAFINDELVDDCIDDIHHEINHLLQYSKGATKNEQLYDKCVGIIRNNNVSQEYKAPAYALYFSFKHEQDSFTPQFYSYLKRTNDRRITYEQALNNFYIYSNLYKSYNFVVDNQYDDEIRDCIQQMRISWRKWLRLTTNGLKRLKKKLRGAYTKWQIDTMRTMNVEGIVKRNIHLYEQYGFDIRIKIEQNFDF